LARLLERALDTHGALVRSGETTAQGRAAVTVTDVARRGTLYVATTGAPYPLEIVKHGATAGRLSFYGWNRPVTLEAPAQAINIKQLQTR
jgi:hypothetical protein